jgi:mannosyltransferase
VFATVLSAIGAARPSLWFDEAATISAGTRSVSELWRMLGNIDAVHGLYYLLMHGWFAVFPATEFFSRLSSSLTVGVAAAGVVVLGRQLSTRSVALTAGIVFAVLPRVTWAGMETRSYAATMAVAVWLTVFCVLAARRGGRWGWWLAYALMVVAATLLNLFLVLMAPVHAVVVAACTPAGVPRAAAWRRWALSTALAVAAVVPFLLFCQTQLFQVGWIPKLDGHTVGEILQEQYFDLSLPAAIFAGLVFATGIIVGVLRDGRWTRAGGPGTSRLLVVTLAWITIPTLTLLAYSVVRHPIYYPRYLSFTVPAMALLLGLSIVAVGRTRSGIAAILALFAVASAPNYLAERGPYAKADMDYSAVADVIDRYAAPSDCLILDNSTAWAPGPIRPLTAARPSVYQKLHDYGRGLTAVQRNRLWDSHIAIWAWADKIPDCTALWTVSEYDPAVPDHQKGQSLKPGPRLQRAMAYQVPSRFGFHVVERWQFSFAQLTKSTR